VRRLSDVPVGEVRADFGRERASKGETEVTTCPTMSPAQFASERARDAAPAQASARRRSADRASSNLTGAAAQVSPAGGAPAPSVGETYSRLKPRLSSKNPDPTAALERQRRHTFELLLVCAVGLVPWTVMLALTLPAQYHVHTWRVTWVGFDALLLAAMASTVFFGWRRRIVVIPALTTAVLLICDAWFDVSLDFGTPDVWTSAALAAFVELPLAAFLVHRVHSLVQPVLRALHELDGQGELYPQLGTTANSTTLTHLTNLTSPPSARQSATR
jgi:hypothetical protein